MKEDEIEAEARQIIADGAEWAEAMIENDADRIGSFMADDWVIVSERGVSEKEHFLSFVRSGRLTHSRFEMTSEPRVRIYGDTAVMTYRLVNTAHFDGQKFDADEWTTEVLVKRGGKWLCVLSHITTALKDLPGQSEQS